MGRYVAADSAATLAASKDPRVYFTPVRLDRYYIGGGVGGIEITVGFVRVEDYRILRGWLNGEL